MSDDSLRIPPWFLRVARYAVLATLPWAAWMTRETWKISMAVERISPIEARVTAVETKQAVMFDTMEEQSRAIRRLKRVRSPRASHLLWRRHD